MNQPLKISIPKPCREDWHTMLPGEQGNLCLSCQKSVIDFSEKSTEEIQAYFKNHAGQKVCGRFRKTQVEQPVPVAITPARQYARWKVAAVLLASLFAGQAGTAMQIKPAYELQQPAFSVSDTTRKEEIKPGTVIIRGTVTGFGEAEPLKGASVRIKNSSAATLTDEKGNFSILLPENLKKKSIVIEIVAAGYEDQELKLKPSEFSQHQQVALTAMILGEVIIEVPVNN